MYMYLLTLEQLPRHVHRVHPQQPSAGRRGLHINERDRLAPRQYKTVKRAVLKCSSTDAWLKDTASRTDGKRARVDVCPMIITCEHILPCIPVAPERSFIVERLAVPHTQSDIFHPSKPSTALPITAAVRQRSLMAITSRRCAQRVSTGSFGLFRTPSCTACLGRMQEC